MGEDMKYLEFYTREEKTIYLRNALGLGNGILIKGEAIAIPFPSNHILPYVDNQLIEKAIAGWPHHKIYKDISDRIFDLRSIMDHLMGKT
jgi:hypothetical protein